MPEEDTDGLLRRIDALLAKEDKAEVDAGFRRLLDEYGADGDAQTGPRPGYITLLNEYAGWLRGTSRFADSERYFRMLLSALEQAHAQHSVAYARALLNLAGLKRLLGDPQQALELTDRAEKIVDGSAQDDRYVRATVMNSRMLAYIAMGDYQSAADVCKRLIESLNVNPETGEHEAATAFNNLAGIYLKMNDLDNAETAANAALDIYAHMADENIHHGAALETMGVVMYRRCEYAKAAECFERSAGLVKRYFGENDEYRVAQRNLAAARAAMEVPPGATTATQTAAAQTTATQTAAAQAAAAQATATKATAAKPASGSGQK
ncbi:MAG: tetratricopeptide repeat protein [Coriobacteriales bacterium]|jgi:tetratricopeptide (TPR) repeat protein|nr:tetratricopeptide repeat protein [Coriobacteriales bacterium]